MGIEPTTQPWEGRVLPLYYAREYFNNIVFLKKCNIVIISIKHRSVKAWISYLLFKFFWFFR